MFWASIILPEEMGEIMGLARNRWLMLLLLMALSCAPVRPQEAEEVIKVDISLVTVNVSVTDARGRHLSGLRAEDFLVTDEGDPVRLDFFNSQGSASIIFVVDMSSSMRGEKWQRLKAGMKKFLATAREGNDYTLIAFSDAPQLIASSVGAEELWQKFSGLKPSGQTALYDALLLGLSALEQVAQRHKALVLLSDGQDNSSHAGLPHVQQEVLTHRASIYTVGILLHKHDLFVWEHDGRELLNQLAAATGGLVLFPALEEIRGVLETINADLSNQYSLSYYSPSRVPGWRRIQVNLTRDSSRLNLRYQQRYLIR